MILQSFSDAQLQQEVDAAGGDWRAAIGAMVLAWCAMHDPERSLVTIRKWGVISFTIRVKHLAQVVPVIFGTKADRKDAPTPPAPELAI